MDHLTNYSPTATISHALMLSLSLSLSLSFVTSEMCGLPPRLVGGPLALGLSVGPLENLRSHRGTVRVILGISRFLFDESKQQMIASPYHCRVF